MTKNIFKEEQRFNQWWLIALIAAILIFITYQFVLAIQQPSSDLSGFFIAYTTLALMCLLFVKMVLRTKIDEKGIHIKFWPVYANFKSISWEEIEKVRVDRYSPLWDFGGWGYRISLKGKGTAINVKGNKGIKLDLKNGRHILIGTQKPDEAKMVISNYFNS